MQISLIELFEKQNQTVPQSQKPVQRLPLFKQLTVTSNGSARESPDTDPADPSSLEDEEDGTGEEHDFTNGVELASRDGSTTNLIHDFLGRKVQDRVIKSTGGRGKEQENGLSRGKQKLVNKLGRQSNVILTDVEPSDAQAPIESDFSRANTAATSIPILDFNQRMAEQQTGTGDTAKPSPASSSSSEESIGTVATITTRDPRGVVQNAFERMRPRHSPLETATITVGPKTFTSAIGSPPSKRHRIHVVTPRESERGSSAKQQASQKFGSALQAFAAPGTLTQRTEIEDHEVSEDGSERRGIASTEDPASQRKGEVDVSATSALRGGNAIADDSEAEDSSVDQFMNRDDEGSEDDYIDEETKKAKEERRVDQLIHEAEQRAARPSEDNDKRAHRLLKGGGRKDSTTQLVRFIETSIEKIATQLQTLQQALKDSIGHNLPKNIGTDTDEKNAEERLSLTVTKGDFANMRIVGQFNLGFILATRSEQPSPNPKDPSILSPSGDELFIIDQHASDEKYNFECLQASTIVQNQRLVRPRTLDLTAIEEEIIIENLDALLKNGFLVDVDQSGDEPVGKRCKLVSLPMSREVTFDTRDLEELLALLAESPTSTSATVSKVPRPSKVRRMFAMRACRSSVMIGKTLTPRQMERLVRNMGTIDKPWNCPHGRPTMRHLAGLADWDGWQEGQGIVGLGEEGSAVDWAAWVGRLNREAEIFGREGGDDDEEEEALVG